MNLQEEITKNIAFIKNTSEFKISESECFELAIQMQKNRIIQSGNSNNKKAIQEMKHMFKDMMELNMPLTEKEFPPVASQQN